MTESRTTQPWITPGEMMGRMTTQPWMMPIDLMRMMTSLWVSGLGTAFTAGRGSFNTMEQMMTDRNKHESRDRERDYGVQKGIKNMAESFETQVEQALSYLRVPTNHDIEELTRRVDLLTAEISSVRSGRMTYHVVPDNDGWAVKTAGDQEILSRHEVKDDAISAARELAHANAPSHIAIHRRDGTIQAHHSYGDTDA